MGSDQGFRWLLAVDSGRRWWAFDGPGTARLPAQAAQRRPSSGLGLIVSFTRRVVLMAVAASRRASFARPGPGASSPGRRRLSPGRRAGGPARRRQMFNPACSLRSEYRGRPAAVRGCWAIQRDWSRSTDEQSDDHVADYAEHYTPDKGPQCRPAARTMQLLDLFVVLGDQFRDLVSKACFGLSSQE